MTTLGPRAFHLAPIPAPIRTNLLSSVAAEPRPSEGRWQTGIEYQPERYVGYDSVDPCLEGTKTITDPPANVQWDPYIIWAADHCSTVGNGRVVSDRIEATSSRARRLLETQTSHILESILWTNTVNSIDFGATHPNVSLSDTSVANGATLPTQAQIDAGYVYVPTNWINYPLVTAWRFMMEAMKDMLGGARGMIHVESRLAPDLVYAGLAIQNGGRLVTTIGDHVVIAGTGYTGSSPDEGAASDFHSWMYGTSMVEVLMSPIDVPGEGADLIDRTNNQIEVRAERMALAHWDRQAHIAVPVCLEDPFGDCSDAGS